MKLTIVLAILASILFAVACGGGKDADAPAVALTAIAPTDAQEPNSAPNPLSSQSSTPPPISMVLDTVSPELLSCVKTALGDEQYDAIITARQDAVAEQLGLVLPCILQYPQESNAIMEMFGLDIGTIMAASTPVPDTDGQLTRGKLDPAIEVKVFDREKVWPGTTLLNDNHDEDWPRIIEVNMLGEVVWEYVISKDLWDGEPFRAMDKDVELLANGNILFGLPRRGIFEINRDGEVVWSHLDEKISHDVDRLPNGNTLYNFGAGDTLEDAQVKEVSPEGEIVWEWSAKEYFNSEPYLNITLENTDPNGWTHNNAVERLDNGNTLISPRNFGILVEVDPSGAVVRTMGEGLLKLAHEPELLPNGNVLVANHDKPPSIIEFNPDTNEVVWRHTPDFRGKARFISPLRDADQLPNGNVLITGYGVIYEVTRDGEIVWELALTDKETAMKGWHNLGFYKAQRIGIDSN